MDYRNPLPLFQSKLQGATEYGFISLVAEMYISVLAPLPALLYTSPMCVPPYSSVRSRLVTSASYRTMFFSALLASMFFGNMVTGGCRSVLAQMPGRTGTASGPIGASMAVLAILQDADVLPPEGTPEANRVIKVVIQFQSVFMKSTDPNVQGFLNQALAAQEKVPSAETLLRFRSSGWTSELLEALNGAWSIMAIDQREQFTPGFRQFNVSLEDFDWLMELVTKARIAFEQRGQHIHQVFAQRRREMPGGAQ